MLHIITTLQGKGLCKAVYYKELFLPRDELEGAPGRDYNLCSMDGDSLCSDVLLLALAVSKLLGNLA